LSGLGGKMIQQDLFRQKTIGWGGYFQQEFSDLCRFCTGIFFQKEGGGAADKGRGHGGTAHTDIVFAYDVFSAAARQRKIIIGGEGGNDVIPRCPQVWQEGFLLCETGEGRGGKAFSVFPCPDGNDTAADRGRRMMSCFFVRVSCGGYHYDARFP